MQHVTTVTIAMSFTCGSSHPCYLRAIGAIHSFRQPEKNLHIVFTVGLSFLQVLQAIASCLSPAPLAPCPKPAEDEEREKKREG